MNVWIASDIHGSALYCRKLLDLMERQGADRLVLLVTWLKVRLPG